MMDSFELTKIAGWVLTALLVIFGTKTLVGLKQAGHGQQHAGYTLPLPTANAGAAGAAAPAAAAAFDVKKVAEMVATASVDAGKDAFGKCKACHSIEAGKHGVGPSLAGVVGRKVASAAGFGGYSPALQAKGGEWTPEALVAFLNDPKAAVPNNKMTFAGFKGDAGAIASVIAFLATAK
ncbi:MAG: c-type cytochrome [Pseudomonadota bacterium]